jgi:hypothetical protein
MKNALDDFRQKNKARSCSTAAGSQALGYFMARTSDRLKTRVESCQTTDPKRHLMYINAGIAMPFDVEQRKPFFIDNAHMSDMGQDRVGSCMLK